MGANEKVEATVHGSGSCPTCGSPGQFVLWNPCALDRYDPDPWHSTFPGADPEEAWYPADTSVLSVIAQAAFFGKAERRVLQKAVRLLAKPKVSLLDLAAEAMYEHSPISPRQEMWADMDDDDRRYWREKARVAVEAMVKEMTR